MRNQSYQFVVNPLAGGKNKDNFISKARKRFSEAGLDMEVSYTQEPGHATQLAAESSADCVVAVGGDGTVNEVAKGLVDTGKVLGIIPYGSGNGLARHLGYKMNAMQALDLILDGFIVDIDSATINGIPFFCTCGVGLDAAVDFRYSRSGERGLKTYVRSGVREWFNFKPEQYTISIDGESFSAEASMITIGNANQWGNNAFITPHASIVDGELDIAIVDPLSLADVPIQADLLLTKRLIHSRHVHYHKGKEIVITRSGDGHAHYDGEPVDLGSVLEIRVRPSSLRALVKRFI